MAHHLTLEERDRIAQLRHQEPPAYADNCQSCQEGMTEGEYSG